MLLSFCKHNPHISACRICYGVNWLATCLSIDWPPVCHKKDWHYIQAPIRAVWMLFSGSWRFINPLHKLLLSCWIVNISDTQISTPNAFGPLLWPLSITIDTIHYEIWTILSPVYGCAVTPTTTNRYVPAVLIIKCHSALRQSPYRHISGGNRDHRLTVTHSKCGDSRCVT